ncbi:nucleotidyltransferase family protein [bacterium]|nr:nucleotidyltransferase family protein [bacterium]
MTSVSENNVDFSLPINVLLLAGGQIKDLDPSEPKVASKGHILLGSKPMSSYTLQALKNSQNINKIILVSPLREDELDDNWQGVTTVAPAGESLIDSIASGMEKLPESTEPVLVVAGDLPFLTVEAVDHFIKACQDSPQSSIWYGFVEKGASIKKYPHLHHTWVKMKEGTFCGSGLSCMRRNVVQKVRKSLAEVTASRKNPLKITKILGLKTLFYMLIGRLSVTMAEEAGERMMGLKCKGILSPFAEAAYNIDDATTLKQAREDLKNYNSSNN